MPFQFPDKPEIHLANPPLVEVVCQIRFPLILRMAQESPVEFQERIRDDFPELSLEQNLRFRAPQVGQSGGPPADAEPTVYRFTAVDERAILSLAPNFFAVTMTSYSHWENFKGLILSSYHHVREVYNPAHFTRIGLRYINRLTLANTKAADRNELVSLLNPDLNTVFCNPAAVGLTAMVHQLTFADDPAQLNLRIVYAQENEEPTLFLDLDIFESGKLSLANLSDQLDLFHKSIYEAFRWCIRDETLERFQYSKSGGER